MGGTIRTICRRQTLAPAVFALSTLLAAPAAPAAVSPGLAESARQLEAFPATAGQAGVSESDRLKQFFDLYWATRMRASPALATYVGYPGRYDRWRDYSPETFALIRRIARLERAALASIDRARLAPAEQLNYDLLVRRLDLGIEGERFAALGELLVIDQMSGVPGGYVLSFMPGRTVEDYEDMLAYLRGYPKVIDQILALLAKGLAAGITPPRVTLRDVPEQVQNLLADDPAKSPLLERFQELPETIPEAERERLRREAARVFTEQVAPALRKLHDYLAGTYVPNARDYIALSDLPDGKALYAFQLRNYTTTDLTPEQIHQLGLAEVARIRKEMDALIAATGFKGSFEEFCAFLRTDPRFFYDDPEAMVSGYRDIAKRIDPELIKLFGRLPRLPYGVTPMNGAAAKSAPVAYYSNGSVAAGLPGWFLINTYDLKSRPKWGMEALTLHEAVPVHHLQYSIAQELEQLPEWRKWDVYPAFSEGWGLYAESLGGELGLYKDPYSKFGQLTYEMWRAIRLVVDTGLHTKGWTRQQAIDYYRANSARLEHEIVNEVDRIIVQPGSVPAYKVGELKIKELRAYAERELGPRFDLRAFHDHILGGGQLPLDLLEKSVKAWVAEAKDRRPAR
jgi:uncharacterized protein (DUF885 family)